MPQDIPVKRLPIDLDQFLKVAGVVPSGGEAKHLIAEGMVVVNDEVEHRRRRQLTAGDIIRIDGDATYRIAPADPDAPA